jgi:hypothetical protein
MHPFLVGMLSSEIQRTAGQDTSEQPFVFNLDISPAQAVELHIREREYFFDCVAGPEPAVPGRSAAQNAADKTKSQTISGNAY